jgi:3-dehydroquinate synthase
LALAAASASAFLLPSAAPTSSSGSSHSSRRSCRPLPATTAGQQQQAGAMEVVNVELGDRSYPIYIGPGLLTKGDAPLLTKHISGKRALVVTNDVRFACVRVYA